MTMRPGPPPGRSARRGAGRGSRRVFPKRTVRDADGVEPLDGPRRMALDGLATAFEEAEAARDWFAMRRALSRVEDAVQAVWYASRVRDDGRG